MDNDPIKKHEKNESNGDYEKWVHDSSLDHQGRIPLRSSTGAWKASFFIIGIEFSEKFIFFGTSTSLIIYLTKEMHQDLQTAAKNANNWIGVTTTIMPLIGGFLSDAYLGRFYAILASSVVYLLGLLLLTMSQLVPSLERSDTRPRTIHEIVFYIAMYLISVATGGLRPTLVSFGVDQFDNDYPLERKMRMSFFNFWNSGLCSGILLGVTLIVYIQDNVSWATADIIYIAVMAIVVLLFYTGKRVYRFRKATGSSLLPLLQVFTAAVAKRNLPYPSAIDQLYEVPVLDKDRHGLLPRTNKLKFLDKAVIIEQGQSSSTRPNPWRLATVTQVEETKLVIHTVPIWLSSLPVGICITQASTFFINQATTLDRELTNGFTIPPASIFVLAVIGMIIPIAIYDKFIMPYLKQNAGNRRGSSALQKNKIGMIISVITMIVAALVEGKRLKDNPGKGSDSMGIIWLAPQFLLIGLVNGLSYVGLQEYFYEEMPCSMKSLGIAVCLSVLGTSNFICNVLITVVDHITTMNGGRSWFGKDLNSSRLDYFYWLLVGISAGNLCIYEFIERRYYSYKAVRTSMEDA